MVNILNKHYMSIYKKIILYCNYVTRNVFHICPIGNLSLVMSCQDTNHYSNLLSSLGMRPPCRYNLPFSRRKPAVPARLKTQATGPNYTGIKCSSAGFISYCSPSPGAQGVAYKENPLNKYFSQLHKKRLA